jgi:hypothetical protein
VRLAGVAHVGEGGIRRRHAAFSGRTRLSRLAHGCRMEWRSLKKVVWGRSSGGWTSGRRWPASAGWGGAGLRAPLGPIVLLYLASVQAKQAKVDRRSAHAGGHSDPEQHASTRHLTVHGVWDVPVPLRMCLLLLIWAAFCWLLSVGVAKRLRFTHVIPF